MHFISANNEISKAIFSPKEEIIALGDFLKFEIDDNSFIVSVVTKIKTIKENEKFNLAISRNFLFVENNNVKNWNGQIPAPKTNVEKTELKTLLSLVDNASKEVAIGKNKDEVIKISIDALKQNTFVFSDNQENKVEFIKSSANELIKNNQQAIIFDFLGEFNFGEKITAGKDFKLLLSAKTIDAIYNKGLKDALIETRAVIEDVFAEIKNYLKEDENNFIPFNSFKEVISAEKSVPELIVLKNQLEKYQEQNIFADEKEESAIFEQKFQDSNLLVIDLSKIPLTWAKEFIEASLEFKAQNPTFCFFDIKEGIIEETLITKLLKEKEETNIYPIMSLGYSNKSVETVSYLAKNLILFSPNIFIKQFPQYSTLLSNLDKNEFIALIEELKNIPITLKTIKSEYKTKQEIPEITLDNIFETPSNIAQEAQEEVIEKDSTQEIQEEATEEDFTYETQEIEQIFTQETVPIFEAHSDEIEYVQEDFDFDELDLDDIDEAPSYGTQADLPQDEDDDFELIEEDDIQEEITDEIIDDVESLYTSKKENEADDFSNNTLPVYQTPQEQSGNSCELKEGDDVVHQKYGTGVVKKIINYGPKTLLSIQFDKAGRRLLDPNLAGLEKINAG